MIGQLLEFSVAVPAIAPTLLFYRGLGFEELDDNSSENQGRAAVWDGNICVGLHQDEFDGPALSFVRPNLADYLRVLRKRGIEFESVQTADDEFNTASFRDPNGRPIHLLEARTHSPGAWNTGNVVACGEFIECSVATDSLERSMEFWAGLGFVVAQRGEQPQPWIRMTGCGLSIGFHRCGGFRAGLSFRAIDLEARLQFLGAKNYEPSRGSPLTSGVSSSATLIAPDGTQLFLLA